VPNSLLSRTRAISQRQQQGARTASVITPGPLISAAPVLLAHWRGFEHTGTLTDVGVLTWSVELEDLSKLSEVSGVRAVGLERAPSLKGSHAAG
jgi:hypothetical protein